MEPLHAHEMLPPLFTGESWRFVSRSKSLLSGLPYWTVTTPPWPMATDETYLPESDVADGKPADSFDEGNSPLFVMYSHMAAFAPDAISKPSDACVLAT